MNRLKLTVAIGLTMVLTTSVGILWSLGVFFHHKLSGSPRVQQVQITPDCVLVNELQVEFKILSVDNARLDIVAEFPQQKSNSCTELQVSSSHEIELISAVAPPTGQASGARRSSAAQRELRTKERQYRAPDGELRTHFDVHLKDVQRGDSVWLSFKILDSVALTSYSEGEIFTIFFVDNVASRDGIVSFLSILGREVRATARDLDAVLEDPRKPNIFRHEFSPTPGRPSMNTSVASSIEFSVEFPERERFKDGLLVILSALFGVGISALFESLLAAEVYNRLASGFLRGIEKTPNEDGVDTEEEESTAASDN